MTQLIASNQLTLTNLKENAVDRTEISFWHGLSATKRPLGVYDCSNRDHRYGNEFNVTSGKTYTVRVIAKQTKGSLSLRGGIWYTSMTSGNAWDGLANFTLVGDASEDGLGIYERKLVVESGKTKAKLFIHIDQWLDSSDKTAWRIYDGQVFDENGQPLVTDQNNYGALTSPMATPNGTYIWKRTVTYYTDGTSNTIWEYNGVGAKGKTGASAYFYVAYADSPDGSTGFNLDDASKRYMGHYSSSNPTQSTSAASYKWVDRANVTSTFVQSTAPANPPAGSRWKYTGSTVITANSSTINPGEQYLFIGARWVKDVITSDNLQIKDKFINGPMIENGAVTVEKLNVGDLSAISANLGSVTAGKMLLQRSFSAGSSAVPAYSYPAFKTGLFVDNWGLIVNGPPVRPFGTETTATDMPVVVVTSGEIRFLRTNLTDNIEKLMHTGLYDNDFGYIRFGRDIYGKNALVIEANGQVYLRGENYTDWDISTIANGVQWKVQGNLVIVNYDLTFSTVGPKHIVTIPTKYVPKALMLTVKAWDSFVDRDRNAQLNADGSLHLLWVDANLRYCGQFIWAY